MALRVLGFMAHPDDVELTCAGTLIRLKQEADCKIAIATATSGDCGSMDHRPDEIARIRHAEAQASAELLGAEYYCAGCMDLFVMYDEPTLRRFTEVLRKARPDVVITQPPADYMVDHETTGKLVRSACFAAPIPNVWTNDPNPAPPLAKIPHLYYCDPLEAKEIYGNPVKPQFVVDVSSSMELKTKMLASHVSQREWLRKHHGMDEYIEAMKRACAARGQLIGKSYGEAFRQHLGHGYPQDNIIAELLK
ncbi:MAG: PIG-L family deacetylase [Phycisphaerae bacterium]|nr:PIG-L family deacetylase [Phycisphaerae bacterium]